MKKGTFAKNILEHKSSVTIFRSPQVQNMAEMRHLRRNRTNNPPQKNSLLQLINVPLVRKPPYSPYSRVYLVPCLKKNETVYQR